MRVGGRPTGRRGAADGVTNATCGGEDWGVRTTKAPAAAPPAQSPRSTHAEMSTSTLALLPLASAIAILLATVAGNYSQLSLHKNLYLVLNLL